MTYLIFSVLISSFLLVIFRGFSKYKIDTLKAIVINYIVAFSMGLYFSESKIPLTEIHHQPWIYGALVLGGLFVSIFFVMAKTAQNNGVSVASIAGKMSVVIPIIFGIFLYNESMGWVKVSGILIALIAVYLASAKDEKNENSIGNLLFPILLFFGSGAIDTVLKYVEINFVPENEVAIFSGSLFGIAGLFGVIILLFKTFKNNENFGFKNIIAGIVLGIPNYFSIFFLIKALQNKNMDSATLFTINNIGIVLFSSFLGFLIFKEKFSTKNIFGVFLAVLGILIIAFSK